MAPITPDPIPEPIIVWASSKPNWFLVNGKELPPPPGWSLVRSGDPALTRRLKKTGPCWVWVHKRKNRIETIGLWTESDRIGPIAQALEKERAAPSYQKRLETARQRRAEQQMDYVAEFDQALRDFLSFSPRYKEFQDAIVDLISVHSTPVGSGTVARTKRLPIAQRAEAAVIAWMRHQTTAYDDMSIAHVKGARREVRRELAARSRVVLARYRSGEEVNLASCPLAKALKRILKGCERYEIVFGPKPTT